MEPTGYCSKIVTDQNSITDPSNLLGNTTASSYGTYAITWCQENHLHDGPEYIHCGPGGWSPSIPVCRGLDNLDEKEYTQDPWAYVVLGVIGGLLLIFFMIAIIIISRHKRKQRDYKGLGKQHRHKLGGVIPAPVWFGRGHLESNSATSSEINDYHGEHPSKDKAGSHGDPRLDPTIVGRPWIHTINRGDDTVDRHGSPAADYRDDTYWNRYSNTHLGHGMRPTRSEYQLGATSLKPAVRAHSDYTQGYMGAGMGDAFGMGHGGPHIETKDLDSKKKKVPTATLR